MKFYVESIPAKKSQVICPQPPKTDITGIFWHEAKKNLNFGFRKWNFQSILTNVAFQNSQKILVVTEIELSPPEHGVRAGSYYAENIEIWKEYQKCAGSLNLSFFIKKYTENTTKINSWEADNQDFYV